MSEEVDDFDDRADLAAADQTILRLKAELERLRTAAQRALAVLKELASDRQTDYERLIGKVVDGLNAALRREGEK